MLRLLDVGCALITTCLAFQRQSFLQHVGYTELAPEGEATLGRPEPGPQTAGCRELAPTGEATLGCPEPGLQSEALLMRCLLQVMLEILAVLSMQMLAPWAFGCAGRPICATTGWKTNSHPSSQSISKTSDVACRKSSGWRVHATSRRKCCIRVPSHHLLGQSSTHITRHGSVYPGGSNCGIAHTHAALCECGGPLWFSRCTSSRTKAKKASQ